MSDPFHRVLEKLDAIDTRIDVLAVSTARNAESLEQHMEQTLILKEEIKQERSETAPLKKAYEQGKGAIWLVGVIAAAIIMAKTLGIF
jgi:hypothetical protein